MQAMAGPNQPSMDEILASIKKVIAEEKEFLAPKSRAKDGEGDDVLELDETMVEEPQDGTGHEPAVPPASLMADDAAASSKGAFDELEEVTAQNPAAAAGNPLEEMIRDMLRPMLKQYLDEKLPGIIEAQVKAEISRITGRKL